MVSSTITSPQAGNITLASPQRMQGLFEGINNGSENIADWSGDEFRNFVKWFIEVHHPEAVKQYQAIRAIERKAEESARLEAELAQAEFIKQYWANQAKGAQNAYPYSVPINGPYTTTTTQQGYGIAVQTEPPPKQGFFENLKRLLT